MVVVIMSNLPDGCTDAMVDASIPLSDWEIEQIEGVDEDSRPIRCFAGDHCTWLPLSEIPFY